jgi:putative transposase
MPEHAHVLLFPRDDHYDVAQILKSIKQRVARKATNWLRQHAPEWIEHLRITWPDGRTEFRFWEQGGGYDRNIFEPKVAWAAVDYLHHNPVRRGLVSCATDWPWSSARCYAGWVNVELLVDAKPPDPL